MRPGAFTRAAAFVILASGCGAGTALSIPSDGGRGASDSGAPSTSPCPTGLPAAGDACTLSSSIACEYGSDVNGACDRTAVCSGGHWSLSSTDAGATCPTPTANIACPAYESKTNGTACANLNQTCGYASGRCVCNPGSLVAGQPPSATNWQCDTPPTGCPLPRPALGSPCTIEGESCDYGSCTLPQGVVEQCTQGLWEPGTAECPL